MQIHTIQNLHIKSITEIEGQETKSNEIHKFLSPSEFGSINTKMQKIVCGVWLCRERFGFGAPKIQTVVTERMPAAILPPLLLRTAVGGQIRGGGGCCCCWCWWWSRNSRRLEDEEDDWKLLVRACLASSCSRAINSCCFRRSRDRSTCFLRSSLFQYRPSCTKKWKNLVQINN